MSYMISIFSEVNVSKDEVYSLVKKLNGDIITIDEFTKGVIAQGEAAIWIYYRGEIEKEDIDIVNKIEDATRLKVKNEVAIEIGHDDYSDKLAAYFCIHFMEKYPKTVVVTYRRIMNISDVIKWYNEPIIEY